MRQVTATEKYNAVLEGKMAKKEFVRQMRQTFPQFVSQYNGFDDTVQILKNRQMIFETVKPAFSEAKVYDDRPALTYSLDALDRGIRVELGVMGIDMAAQTVKPEEFKQAEKKAKDNLEKDANHYLNLMSGESNKVDKHDKEKEVKRGAADKDTFNDMKKATLKEGYTEEQISTAVQRIKERRAGEHEDGTPKSNAEMGDDEREDFYNNLDSVKERLTEKLSNPTLLAAVKQIKAMHPEITSGIVDDFIDMHGQDILDGADPMDEFHNYIDANYEGPSDMREKKGKDHDGDGDIDSDDYMAAKDKAIKKAMGKDVDEDQERDHNFYDNKEKAEKIMQIAKDAIALMDEQPGTSVKDAIEAVIEFMDESYAMKRMQQTHTQDRLAGKKSTYDQAKEKNKDQEKQLKEAIKSIIKKTLLNEAATIQLADWADEYETFPGVKPVVNELENIVTEIETFYDKMSDKIKNVFEKTAGFENEEGLKIGGFIAPSLESAFRQDLSKVMKKGSFFSKINLPKVRTITQDDIDSLRSSERPLGETDVTEEPKSTVFSPNF